MIFLFHYLNYCYFWKIIKIYQLHHLLLIIISNDISCFKNKIYTNKFLLLRYIIISYGVKKRNLLWCIIMELCFPIWWINIIRVNILIKTIIITTPTTIIIKIIICYYYYCEFLLLLLNIYRFFFFFEKNI